MRRPDCNVALECRLTFAAQLARSTHHYCMLHRPMPPSRFLHITSSSDEGRLRAPSAGQQDWRPAANICPVQLRNGSFSNAGRERGRERRAIACTSHVPPPVHAGQTDCGGRNTTPPSSPTRTDILYIARSRSTPLHAKVGRASPTGHFVGPGVPCIRPGPGSHPCASVMGGSRDTATDLSDVKEWMR